MHDSVLVGVQRHHWYLPLGSITFTRHIVCVQSFGHPPKRTISKLGLFAIYCTVRRFAVFGGVLKLLLGEVSSTPYNVLSCTVSRLKQRGHNNTVLSDSVYCTVQSTVTRSKNGHFPLKIVLQYCTVVKQS